MGVDLGDLLERENIEIKELSGHWIAVDAFNTLYQFLSIIRQQDGTPLKDGSGRTTSHLSGILYRMTNLTVAGAKVVFVFDGEPPRFKRETLNQRAETRARAKEMWERAKEEGLDGFKYAQAASRLGDEMVADSKRLLGAMGIPIVQAPSEGEAQAARMAINGDVDLVGSQDYDALLFGAPKVVRNMAITGKRKLPGKNVYVEVAPEVISLERELSRLGIERRQLVEIAIMCGTDYNAGLKRVGPKTALKLIKEHGDLERVLEVRGETIENADEIRDLFLNPPVTDDYEIEMRKPDAEKITRFLCDERDFSQERVEKAVKRLQEAMKVGQSTLDKWF
ncbi:MAG: flap endonuclease-1 [Methanothrix sp.]|jgi:flap endonuclease-1|uniref:Flap endonuclease 1 n=1 Tax=Methanothrix harundinacea TaxID=301375 RepID=A0A101ILR1_9EURY|nr:MAG: Flap endonuclease 1 [Methanothrix harundinacea]MDD2639235.1 flap endonuclease-1 [Methanothrix sp.]MDI9399890.1 flap endonuclease-1 [Euryarchaeota archaeon]KUK97553.1 MAG: Flap endonuclease 1 [Methanothrix harundinacea]MCP1393360.1 flap endonuclease-1 [Methanothrix harundinacea]